MKGPYYRYTNNRDQFANATYYRQANGTKVRVPLPYYKTGITITSRQSTPNYGLIQGPWEKSTIGSFCYYSGNQTGAPSDAEMYNTAYARWVKSYMTQMQVAVDMFELRQTLELLAALAKAARRPCAAVAAARKTFLKRRQRRSAAKDYLLGDIPDAWLAFHFGLRPLFQSIHDGLEVHAKRDISYIVARGTAKQQREDKRSGLSGLNYHTQGIAHWKIKIQSEIVVTNPNAFLMNQLGLINPASVAWELVPFSFLVDWFVNVGQVISSLTDRVGVTVKNGFVTRYAHGSGYNHHWGLYQGKIEFERCNYTYVKMNRTLGIPLPKLRMKIPNFGLTRVATSYALVAQQLSRLLMAR